MAVVLRISNAAALAVCNLLVDRVDNGAAAGKIAIYDGAMPADVDTAVSTQTKLAELAFSDPAFGNASDANPGATAAANAISDDPAADATGTAAWCRITDSDGVAHFDGNVGTAGCFLNLATTSLVAGQPVRITSMAITVSEGA